MGKRWFTDGSLALLFFLYGLHCGHGQNTSGYSCDAAASIYTCETYVLYRSTTQFSNLAAIGDLFHVSRLMISEPSNITDPSSTLVPNQQLLVPITCSCNLLPNESSAISYANLTYTIQPQDTFWFVSTFYFQNLTTYQSVEAVNPTLIPRNLTIGQVVVFPVFCKCSNRTDSQNQTNFIISYVYQPSDNLSYVALFFGTTVESITEVNGDRISPFDTIFIPVSRLPSIPQLVVNETGEAPAPITVVTRTDDRKGVIAGLSSALGICVVLIILMSATCVYTSWKKKNLKLDGGSGNKKRWGKNYGALPDANLIMDLSQCLDKYRFFTVGELAEATDGFSDECRVKGSVFKGSINGEVYAIKMMAWDAREELKILQKVNHGSLVKLEGFCIDPDNSGCYLVYEYVENGSLYTWLHEGGKLSWKTRVSIAVDVANGLLYIHEHTRPRVVHKDLTSSNILIDSAMRAKISNFGLAKSGHNAITKHIVGTQGYVPPEYLADGVVSTKMDVFALGVVLLELVSGKQAVDGEGRLLWATATAELAEDETRKEKLTEWIDDVLIEEDCPMDGVMSMVAIALVCLEEPEKRPTMGEILSVLCRCEDPLLSDPSYEEGLLADPLKAR